MSLCYVNYNYFICYDVVDQMSLNEFMASALGNLRQIYVNGNLVDF